MPEYVCRVTLPKTLDTFTRAYLECAEWCGIDDEQREAFEHAADPRWSDNAIALALADCADFQQANAADIDGREDQAGHDFWLTRNRHGAGFWDRDDSVYPADARKRLTENAHAYGEFYVMYDEASETLDLS